MKRFHAAKTQKRLRPIEVLSSHGNGHDGRFKAMMRADKGGSMMMPRMLLISLLLAMLGPASGAAEDNPLIGTWKLKTFVREVVGTDER
jgi:hypothetical protein